VADKTIFSALVAAQRNFGPALKDKTNPAFRSKYADLGACIDAVMDALNAQGIALIQKQHPHDGGVCIETVFLHESGECFSAGLLTVPATKQDAQGYGSALTYARRYSLMAACGIAPEDDDGQAAAKAKAEAEAKQSAALRSAWLDEQAQKMEACVNAEELQVVWQAAYKVMKAEKDAEAIATLTPVKDRVKATFEANV
jgi:hypothetical protein